jgi:hypothetical protein
MGGFVAGWGNKPKRIRREGRRRYRRKGEREKVIDAYTHTHVCYTDNIHTPACWQCVCVCTCGFFWVGPGRVEKQPPFSFSSSVDDDLLVKTQCALSSPSALFSTQANPTLVDLLLSVLIFDNQVEYLNIAINHSLYWLTIAYNIPRIPPECSSSVPPQTKTKNKTKKTKSLIDC